MKNSPQRLLSFLLVFALLAGCAPAQPVINLTFYKRGYIAGGSDSISTSIAQAVSAFENRHINIHVQVIGIPYDAQGDKTLREALVSGSGINILSVNTYELPEFARAGYLSPIDGFLTAEERADFYKNALTAASINGKIYAWPLWVTAVAIYANPALFTERGVSLPSLEQPWSWEQFAQASQQLTFTRANGSQVYAFSASSLPNQTVYLPFFYLDGGRILSPDGQRFTQNSPQAVSALTKLQQLTSLYHVTAPDFGKVNQTTVRAQFKDGQLAMVMDTPSFIPDMQAQGMDFVALPPPTGDTGKIVTSGAFGMYGVAAVNDPQALTAAHLFANYLTSSQVAQDVPGYQLAPGLRRSNTTYASDAPRTLISRLAGYGIYEPPVVLSDGLRQSYELALQAILLGLADPQTTMNDLATPYQTELDALTP